MSCVSARPVPPSAASRRACGPTRRPRASGSYRTNSWRSAGARPPPVAEGGYVLDTAAVLCLSFGEPGAPRVEALLPMARLALAAASEATAVATDRAWVGLV